MSVQTGVLAALDRHISDLADRAAFPGGRPIANRLLAEAIDARAAVVELIDMAKVADEYLAMKGVGLARGDGLTLKDAIARVGGAA